MRPLCAAAAAVNMAVAVGLGLSMLVYVEQLCWTRAFGAVRRRAAAAAAGGEGGEDGRGALLPVEADGADGDKR